MKENIKLVMIFQGANSGPLDHIRYFSQLAEDLFGSGFEEIWYSVLLKGKKYNKLKSKTMKFSAKAIESFESDVPNLYQVQRLDQAPVLRTNRRHCRYDPIRCLYFYAEGLISYRTILRQSLTKRRFPSNPSPAAKIACCHILRTAFLRYAQSPYGF
jgi:hypothetical protein